MALNDVVVRLLGDSSQLEQATGRARDSMLAFARDAERIRRENATIAAESERQNAALLSVLENGGRVAVAFGAALLAGFGIAAKASADFAKQISAVQAATGATGAALAALRDEALQAGRSTAFGATEAAKGIEELGKAGLSVRDIIGGGLKASTDLAAAGAINLGDAAETVAITLKQFNLSGGDAKRIADGLAAGSNLAAGGVAELRQALAQSGQVAAQTGLSFEETAGALSLFASKGLLGSDAGTSLRTTLLRLVPQSKQAADTMRELGINAFNSQGQFVGLAKFSENLKQSLEGLTQEQRNAALTTIFGSDAIRAATILYQAGADGIDEWTKNVSQSGFAAQQASQRLDNLSGDFTKLRGAVDTALIGLGDSAQGPLRDITQQVTNLVNGFGALPGPAKDTATAVGLSTAAIGLLGWAALLALPRIVAFKKALEDLGPGGVQFGQRLGVIAGTALPVLGAALLVGGAALAEYGKKQAETNAEIADFIDIIDRQTGALKENARAVVAKRLQDSGLLDAARNLGISSKTVTDAVLGEAAAWEEITRQRQRYNTAVGAGGQDPGSQGFDLFIQKLQETSGNLDEARKKVLQLQDATGQGISADAIKRVQDLRDEYGFVAGKAQDAAGGITSVGEASAASADQVFDAEKAVKDFKDALDELFAKTLDVGEANDRFQKSINDLADATKENAKTLEGNTDAAIANRDAIRDRIKAAAEAIKKDAELGAGQDQLTAKTQALKEQIEQAAVKAGFQRSEVEKLTSVLNKVPASVATTITLLGGDTVIQKLSDVQTRATRLDGERVVITIDTVDRATGTIQRVRSTSQADGGILTFAGGGFYQSSKPIAQIAPAGAWRVWAEPETGGEAYIPLALSKRSRSIAVWEETGRRLGVFNDGGGVGGMAAGGSQSSTTYNIYAPTTDARDIVREGTLAETKRLAFRLGVR